MSTALILDGDPKVGARLAHDLEQIGYAPVVVPDWKTAFFHLDHEPVGMLVIAFDTHGALGTRDFLTLLRYLRDPASLSIIVVARRSKVRDAEELQTLGADAVMSLSQFEKKLEERDVPSSESTRPRVAPSAT